jgi:hypothetical protein
MFLTLPWSPDEYRYLHDRTDESVDSDDEKGWGCNAINPKLKAKIMMMTKKKLSQELKMLKAKFKSSLSSLGAKDVLIKRLIQHFRVHPEQIPVEESSS